jgi:hypothetical protein
MKCPNKNSQEWKELVDEYGEDLAQYYWDFMEDPARTAVGINEELEKAVDDQLDKLAQRLAALEKVSAGANRKEIETRKAIIRNSMNKLSQNRTYEKLLEVSFHQINQARKLLEKESKDITAFSLNEASKIVSNLKSITTILAQSSNAEVRKGIDIINKWSLALDVKQKDLVKQMALGLAKQHALKVDPQQMFSLIRDESWLAAATLSISTSHVPLVQLVDKVLTQMDRMSKEIVKKSFDDELSNLLKALNKKKFELSDFKEILEDDGLLINPFTQEYYTKRREIMQDHQNVVNKYVKDPEDSKLKQELVASFDRVFQWYRDNHEYYLTPEGEEEFSRDLNDLTESFTDINGNITAEGEAARARFIAAFSPYMVGEVDESTRVVEIKKDSVPFTKIGEERVYNKNWHRYLVAKPKGYDNPKFSQVATNPLYKFIVDKYLEGLSMMPHETALNVGNYYKFLKDINLMSTSSEFSMRSLFSGIKELAKDPFTVSVTLADLEGEIVEKVINPDGTFSEKVTPVLRTKDEFGRDIPTVNPQTLEDVKKVQSTKDPLELLRAFYNSSVTYQHAVHALPTLELLLHQIESLPAEARNPFGTLIKNALGKPDQVEKGLVQVAAQTRFAVVSKISGRSKFDDSLATFITESQKEELKRKTAEKLKGEPLPSMDVFSGVKTLDSVVDYTRMTLIGLKPLTAASNVVIALVNNYIYAARNKEFQEKHLDQAFRMLWGNMFKFYGVGKLTGVGREEAEKIASLSEKFGIKNTLYENADPNVYRRAKSKLVTFLYALQEGGEFLAANQIMLAMMLNTKVKDSKGKETNLFEAFDNEGNLKPEFDNLEEWKSVEVLKDGENVSKLNDFITALTNIRHRTQGDYGNPIKAKGKVFGRIVFMFRTWLPQAIRERLGEQNDMLDFKGRYRTYWDIIAKKKGKGPIKSHLEFFGRLALTTLAKMTNVLPLGKYRFTKLSDAAGANFDAYLKELGASELDVENMRANIKELDFLFTSMIVAIALTSLKKGDDDDDSYTVNFLINLMNRTQQDLSFFMWPPSAMSIIKDPIPLYKTIQEAGDVLTAGLNFLDSSKDPRFTRGVNEGELRLWKEIKDLLPIFSAIESTQSTVSKVFEQDAYRFTDKR